ncbi:hypothetical protein QZH41_005716 [Actinostola sp. cb2023]|nr:hypothetical protein QZH41_005716 [Actinostola sp. cb2023]
MVVGPSKSGKTLFVQKMIRHRAWLFSRPLAAVVFCYGTWQSNYDDMKREFGADVVWHQGLPEDPYELFPKTPGLLVVDDLMGEMEQSHRRVASWFTKGTHHMDVSLIVLMQNLFPKNMRTASLNAHLIVLFPNPRDRSQFRRLAAQAFPGRPEWMPKALRHAQQKPYRPLIVDFSQRTPNDHRLRVDPFLEDLERSGHPFAQIVTQ